jgi:hypothetical protein
MQLLLKLLKVSIWQFCFHFFPPPLPWKSTRANLLEEYDKYTAKLVDTTNTKQLPIKIKKATQSTS